MSGPSTPRLLSRRRLLRIGGSVGAVAAGVTAAAALGGCDLDPHSSTPAAPAPDPDAHVVDAARAELRDLLAHLRATDGAAGLVACHLAQLAALDGHPATRRRRAWSDAQVVARERRAVARFRRWAVTCDDGDLARVLASIAAGISTQPVLREPV
ncbi:MAG: hypothetical protein QM747_01185 [Nocardioides sp.]